MGSIQGFAKQPEASPLPESIHNAMELEKKVRNKVEKLVREYMTCFQNLNYLEQIEHGDRDVKLSVVDDYAFNDKLTIAIPKKIRDKIVVEERKRLTKRCVDLEIKMNNVLNLMEEMLDAED